MSTWLWVNLALATPFSLAVAGLPLWLVVTRPQTWAQAGPDPVRSPASRADALTPRRAAAPGGAAGRRSPAGAG